MKWLAIIVVAIALLVGVSKVNGPGDVTVPVEESNEESNSDQTFEDKTLPTEIGGKSLDLSNKGLIKVPMYVFSETGLTRLDLSNNRLTGALQAEVRHLNNLKVLDLSDNQFTGVPAEVGQLSKLEELDLSNNQLTGLSHELGNLKNLKKLDLRGNNPSEFDLNIIRESLPNTQILVD